MKKGIKGINFEIKPEYEIKVERNATSMYTAKGMELYYKFKQKAINIYNENGKLLYSMHKGGYCEKREYDDNGRLTKIETNIGYWEKWEYDQNGNKTKFEDNKGYCEEYKYDENGNLTEYKTSDGYCAKWEYDIYGNEIKFEDNNHRPKEKSYTLTELKEMAGLLKTLDIEKLEE